VSRVADLIARSVADAKRRNYEPRPELPEGAVDFDDPVDRLAVMQQRSGFVNEEELASKMADAEGQVALAKVWAGDTPGARQYFRRRAVVTLRVVVSGRELRERPEENIA